MPDGQGTIWNWDFGFATQPNPPDPPTYLAPKAVRPEVLVDQYRVMLMDPATKTLVGLPGNLGAAGPLGRLQYATRSPSNRGY